MKQQTIGFAMCGSFCTYRSVICALRTLHQQYDNIIPIMSQASWQTDTRFGAAKDFADEITKVCGNDILHTLPSVEPIGPKKLLDLLVIAPCTGSTLGKIAHGIADTPVTLACKSHLRNGRPVLLGISTNDALGGNAENIGRLLNRRHFYFVPFGQDSPEGKPCSMIADWSLLPAAVDAALQGRQLQPVLVSY